MSNFIKQPSIKLIPSDPMTNTILIIYCVSSTGASVPYRSTWRKINPKNNKVEEIKNSNGSSYRCSPLDLDCLIEATVYFQHQNLHLSRVVQSNIVKLSRQLKDRKNQYRQPILTRIAIEQIIVDAKIVVQDGALNILLAIPTLHYSHAISINEIDIEVDSSHLVFKVVFKEKMQFFLEFVAQVLGWKPEPNSNFITFTFGSDINRDVILLGIAQYLQKTQNADKTRKIGANGSKDKAQQKKAVFEADKQEGGHNKNKSHTSFSPSGAYKEKFKLADKFVQMKRSFTNLSNNNQQKIANQKKNQLNVNKNEPKPDSKTQHKLQNKDSFKQREFLNVFQEDELQLLGPPPPPPRPISFEAPAKPPPKQQTANDQPSMNLRGSFEQLQKSFNSNLNEQMLGLFRMQQPQQPNKLQQELKRLQNQNQQLKKQLQSGNTLTKQNNTLKRKVHEMREEINRLEMQRKVILTDKLRCEVNWHKQIQEKEQMKKELEYLREAAKGVPLPNYAYQRTARTQSIHDIQSFQRKIENRQANLTNRDHINRSPNSSFYR